ncbi:MAG: hypothetical protein Q8O65_04395 [Nitrosopumilaceae archaeon]|nr:hypothetical protein [Nitrosopumilaceae archaeon]
MKIIVSVLILFALVSLVPQGFAQISLGVPAIQMDVSITIEEDGKVHVVHKIASNTQAQQLNLIEGSVSDLKVTDEDGNDIEFAKVGVEDISSVTIFPTKERVIVEYDLADVLELKDGIWTWNFFYPGSTIFLFPKSADLVFANDRPVNLGYNDAKGIRCHGCQMILEYIINEPVIMQEVKWQDKAFNVEIRTLANITSFNFDQQNKTISFNVENDHQFVTLFIPLELLWNPYQVYLDQEPYGVFADKEKVLKHEYAIDETHIQLNIRPETAGTIRIIGTSVVPEFPLFVPLVLGMSMIMVLVFRKSLAARTT